jgi:hypothetical protein
MGVYVDSSPDIFDDPKVETIVELLARVWVSENGSHEFIDMRYSRPSGLRMGRGIDRISRRCHPYSSDVAYSLSLRLRSAH